MSLQPEALSEIPAETARIARAAFRKGNVIMRLRDEFGTLYADADLAHLFPKRGQPAWSPWRLALITVFQFLEQLSDRDAADAVRARLDWKYALGLELDDPGFDHTVLSEFRTRLVEGHAELLLLDAMLTRFKEHGLLKTRGKQRTDSTHVLSSVRVLSRYESLAETLRAALNQLASTHPEWLMAFIPVDWYSRYGRRIEEFRLPKGKPERSLYIQQVGRDGFLLLETLERDNALSELWQQPSVQLLHLAWSQHFSREGEEVRLKDSNELGPSSERFNSPYDPEARFGAKGTRSWQGYKVHLTETCDDDFPHLVVHARTAPAAQADIDALLPIHTAVEEKHLPPSEHFVDTGYVSTEILMAPPPTTGITVIGPARPVSNWQAKVTGAFSVGDFKVDWQGQQVICPQGHISTKWRAHQQPSGRQVISVRFARRDCLACLVRALCTRNVSGHARELTLLPENLYLARTAQRVVQQSTEWKQAYHRRAGIEGTISQGVRTCGLRQTRYRGQAKTELQESCVASAINIQRVAAWLAGTSPETTRTSRLLALSA